MSRKMFETTESEGKPSPFVYIKGEKGKGAKIIKELRKRGGVNRNKISGNCQGHIYYINAYGTITCAFDSVPIFLKKYFLEITPEGEYVCKNINNNLLKLAALTYAISLAYTSLIKNYTNKAKSNDTEKDCDKCEHQYHCLRELYQKAKGSLNPARECVSFKKNKSNGKRNS